MSVPHPLDLVKVHILASCKCATYQVRGVEHCPWRGAPCQGPWRLYAQCYFYNCTTLTSLLLQRKALYTLGEDYHGDILLLLCCCVVLCYAVFPQVPVGVSSALGYLHLGQVARVKVPSHLLGQAVADDEGALGWVGGVGRGGAHASIIPYAPTGITFFIASPVRLRHAGP